MQGKAKTIALVAFMGVLLIVVAIIYWDDVFPPKVAPPPTPAAMPDETPATQPKPGQPADPGQPQQQPNRRPPISG